jgi:acetylornithine deacetylase/succinyl-diaminopimelate desuccinylase-like protein
VRYVSISTADKSSIALLITAKGMSTHSSMPRPENAIFALSKAMAKLSAADTKPHLIPSTREFFLTLAKTSQPPMSTYFHELATSTDSAVVQKAAKEISSNILYHAIMRDTIAPVFLQAGFRGNVIPGSATATINMRTIPGTTPEDAIAELKQAIDDPDVEVTVAPSAPGMTGDLLKVAAMASRVKPSPMDNPLYNALAESAQKVWPGVPVTPYLFQAGTDAFAWRSRGVPVYGIYPYPITDEDLSRMHGNDERMSVKSLDEGARLIYGTLLKIAAQ